ncbi:MAG: HNH endonuclease [Candidatus Krumholzibacteria bacterium]|nr:HNH endonuclease [Candidatus Krumholzibacteria bacterium]
MTLEQKFKLEFTVDPRFMQKVVAARALLSNRYPRGLEFEKLFEILLDEYLDRHSPESRIRRRGKRESKNVGNKNQKKTGKAQKAHNLHKNHRAGKKRSRIIPQSVRDEVFKRDGGRCTFMSKEGVRCISILNLQIDHIIPYSKGGDNSADNLRLLCAKHNRHEAERVYGKEFMESFYQRE